MIDKYREFNDSLNESIDKLKFEEGDAVLVNDKLLKYIENCGWSNEMKKYVGGTFFIIKVEYNKYRERYMYFIREDAFVYDDCIDLVKPIGQTKIRWYKKGKLENDQ
jgi:phosphosulfolactate synthase (CoM biosynthesis protein A)